MVKQKDCFWTGIYYLILSRCPRWKLHLRPKGLASSQISDNDLPQLPRNKSAVEVLGDFMGYLFSCARTYLQDTHSPELWRSVEDNIDFVLTHPNGWEGTQQSQIRHAAVAAGLVSDTPDGHSRLQLLTEGEASLHFCIGNGLASNDITVWFYCSLSSPLAMFIENATERPGYYHSRCRWRHCRPKCLFYDSYTCIFRRNRSYWM